MNINEQTCTRPLKGTLFWKAVPVTDGCIGTRCWAVLSQVDDDGKYHPVAYFSRKLLPREECHSTIEKECLTIKLGIQAFLTYLLGRPFTILTDHRALVGATLDCSLCVYVVFCVTPSMQAS